MLLPIMGRDLLVLGMNCHFWQTVYFGSFHSQIRREYRQGRPFLNRSLRVPQRAIRSITLNPSMDNPYVHGIDAVAIL